MTSSTRPRRTRTAPNSGRWLHQRVVERQQPAVAELDDGGGGERLGDRGHAVDGVRVRAPGRSPGRRSRSRRPTPASGRAPRRRRRPAAGAARAARPGAAGPWARRPRRPGRRSPGGQRRGRAGAAGSSLMGAPPRRVARSIRPPAARRAPRCSLTGRVLPHQLLVAGDERLGHGLDGGAPPPGRCASRPTAPPAPCSAAAIQSPQVVSLGKGTMPSNPSVATFLLLRRLRGVEPDRGGDHRAPDGGEAGPGHRADGLLAQQVLVEAPGGLRGPGGGGEEPAAAAAEASCASRWPAGPAAAGPRPR